MCKGLRKWLGYGVRTDRLVFPFGHLADFSSSAFGLACDSVPLVGQGWYMPRAGWVVGVHASLDVIAASGGGNLVIDIDADGTQIFTGPTFNAEVNDTTGSTTGAARFAAGVKIGVDLTVTATFTGNDLVGWVEIEMER